MDKQLLEQEAREWNRKEQGSQLCEQAYIAGATSSSTVKALKELLREVCVRANIIFPETEDEIKMFTEKFRGQHELQIKIDEYVKR